MVIGYSLLVIVAIGTLHDAKHYSPITSHSPQALAPKCTLSKIAAQ